MLNCCWVAVCVLGILNVSNVYGSCAEECPVTCPEAMTSGSGNNTNSTTDSSSSVECVLGCTDTEAVNYHPNATLDDNSCEYPTSKKHTYTHIHTLSLFGIFFYSF